MAHILGPEIELLLGQVVQLTRCGVLVPLSLFYQLHEQFVSVIEGRICLVFFFFALPPRGTGFSFFVGYVHFISVQRILPLNPDWQAPLTWVTVWSSDDLRRLYVNKLEPHLTLLLLLLEPDFKAVCVCVCLWSNHGAVDPRGGRRVTQTSDSRCPEEEQGHRGGQRSLLDGHYLQEELRW